jgi:hypothetical protein
MVFILKVTNPSEHSIQIQKNETNNICGTYNSTKRNDKDKMLCVIDMVRTNSPSIYKPKTLHNPYVFFFCYFMSMSSVCYNPIVYFWMHKKFRNEVKQLFSKIFYLVCAGKKRQPAKKINIANSSNRSRQTTNQLQLNKSNYSRIEMSRRFGCFNKWQNDTKTKSTTTNTTNNTTATTTTISLKSKKRTKNGSKTTLDPII